MNWIGAYLGSISPRWITRRITKQLQALPPRRSS
jgi:hypothetical protein